MSLPLFDPAVVPPGVPVRGNRFSRWLGRLLLRLGGWRIEGRFPDAPKMQIIVVPHTSNWDFVIGIQAVIALGIDAHWLAKHTLFESCLGPVLRRLGGIPVNRQAPRGAVEQIVERFNARPALMLAITPEGTRRKVQHWKSGFYRIAWQARVPLVPVFIDYRRKVIGILPPHPLSGDYDADLPAIRKLFADVTPKRPSCFQNPG
ncbi:acyltransferase [Geothermobacter hydrogeniphilus]|uniref:Acyltransferase n=1 Tax=Geothermobacter hydrogeniphilus TaxID=1969733 RepID=A0A2K2H9G6_9BACT|nr:1-acyl-sn-glycerol-3-phosphate acyltransferase [Geothermobacter hydrogeniphilus]PNU19952.1 acyltransferase [Geothermobacter hydrogeniphilus]